MMNYHEITKAVFLFLAVLHLTSLTIKVIFKNDVPVITVIMLAIGVTGFVYTQFLMNGGC